MSSIIFAPPEPVRALRRLSIGSSIASVANEDSPSVPPPPIVRGVADEALVTILFTPVLPDETARLGFARKEAELTAAFAALPVAESRTLHVRLSAPRFGDRVADGFQRLTIERRTRLLNFLADARRRAARARGER